MKKIKGTNDGVINEKKIKDAYNEVLYGDMNSTQQNFIKELDGRVKEDTEIYAINLGGRGYKPDIKIKLLDNDFNVSIKKGGGNSVHQEKTSLFLHFCTKELGMSESEKEALLLLLYGDGTIDGDSIPEERLDITEIKEIYSSEIELVQEFFTINKRKLIERFLIFGRRGFDDNIRADYLYHGTTDLGVWSPLYDEAMDYILDIEPKGKAMLNIGPMTFQVWNRNPTGIEKLEDRRHSIQVKWPSVKEHLKYINEQYLNSINSAKTEYKREKGNNIQGFINQKSIVGILNGNRYGKLPLAMKKMIKMMFPTVAVSDKIIAGEYKSNLIKPRIFVEVGGVIKNLSVRMGSGNSIHQENTFDFFEFCTRKIGVTNEERRAVMIVLYGDYSIDGTGKFEDRMKDDSIKHAFAKELSVARDFIWRNRRVIIERALRYGKEGERSGLISEFLYYGTLINGRCLPYNYIIEKLMEYEVKNKALLSLGIITMQVWNRNLSLNPKAEYKRHSVQFKWGSLQKSLNDMYLAHDLYLKDKYDGDWTEFDLVGHLNKDKSTSGHLWSVLCERLGINDNENIFAVKNTKTIFSELVGRKVLPKSDVFLVRCKISKDMLIDNNYWLIDDDLEGLDYYPIEGSGISCKRHDSKSFTYSKLSQSAFIKLFHDSELGAAISLFVTDKDLHLNLKVITDWGLSVIEFVNYYKNLNSDFSDLDILNIEDCKALKLYSRTFIDKEIKENKFLFDSIFTGKGVFEQPYSSELIYSNGKLKKLLIPKYTITTGSGRHRGIYTIAFKPR